MPSKKKIRKEKPSYQNGLIDKRKKYLVVEEIGKYKATLAPLFDDIYKP